MGMVVAGFSMSLDGFIAGPNDDTQHVFGWMFKGDTDVTVTIGEMELVPVLLGQGVRLFKRLGIEPVELETTQVVEGTEVIHLRFNVVK